MELSKDQTLQLMLNRDKNAAFKKVISAIIEMPATQVEKQTEDYVSGKFG